MGRISDNLLLLIDQAILKKRGEEAPRDYLGASILGAECARQVWYSYHHPKPIDKALTLRKFDVGHALEPIVIQWIKDAGLTIWTHDKNGDQFGFVDGKIAGHCDLIIKGVPEDENTPYLGEIKTANDFYFKQFVKDGIGANEKYLAQVQIYMHKLKLKKCLFFVVNKNTQELYCEVIIYDEFEALRLLNRAKSISVATEAPDRHYDSKTYFKCKMCSYYKECWT